MSRLFVCRNLGLIQPTRGLICRPVAHANFGALNQASQIVITTTRVGQNTSNRNTKQICDSLLSTNIKETDTENDVEKREKAHRDLISDGNHTNSNFVRKDDKASPEQLNELHEQIVLFGPNFFSRPHPLKLCTNDIVFINNMRSVRIQGIQQYALHMALFKAYYNFKHTSNKLQLLNLVTLPEESSIKIRWRIVSRPGVFFFMRYFHKFHSTEIWNDGLSTLHVNKDGKIYCHICDNIDVESDVVNKKIIKNPLVNKGLSVSEQ